jgi:long-subunit acyl-CoA synthetase (AMP-forming)
LHIPSKPSKIDSRGAQVRDWKWLLDSSAVGQSFPKYAAGESQRRAALILWSSGTSGKSKGVILSHQALAASVQALWYGNIDFNDSEVCQFRNE